jgi:hypothetical protein
MSDEIVWADELPDAGRHSRLRVFAQQIRANPGKWGRYAHEYKNSGASTAAANARQSYPDLQWERRGNYLWARFTPEAF